jgi:hypothetical protein
MLYSSLLRILILILVVICRTYKLGENTLTTFGRQQLYDLGISMRLKYGFLLNNFTEANMIPVFRTESQYVINVSFSQSKNAG